MANLAYPFATMREGEKVFISDEGDAVKLINNLGKAKSRYKTNYQVEFEYTYDPKAGGANVTVTKNPNPKRKIHAVGKPWSKEQRAKGTSNAVENSFWRSAFLKAFDVVRPPAVDNDGNLTLLKAVHFADNAVAQYRKFLERRRVEADAHQTKQ